MGLACLESTDRKRIHMMQNDGFSAFLTFQSYSKLALFKEEQRPDRSIVASHVGSAVLAQVVHSGLLNAALLSERSFKLASFKLASFKLASFKLASFKLASLKRSSVQIAATLRATWALLF